MSVLRAALLVLLCCSVSRIDGYRILGLFAFQGKSHFVMFDALMRGLAERGHQVDLISHYPRKNPLPNYRDIVDLSGTRHNMVNSFSINYTQLLQGNALAMIAGKFGTDVCKLMGHERMQKFIRDPNRPQYDMVIIEIFGTSCYTAFGKLLNAPVAVAVSSHEFSFMDDFIGNPHNSAHYPHIFSTSGKIDGFFDRLRNTVENIVNMNMYYYYTTRQNDLVRKYLGKDMPDVRTAERNVSLLLVNSFHTFDGIRATTPALVEVGGLHVDKNEAEITPELSQWLDESKHGVVYFTLGSLVNIETLPKETILDMYASFRKISPIRVLMKIGKPANLPPGLPDNVRVSSWIPQVPVLRHKNTKVFITHGGLMGSQEALYHGVPIIGIPLFGDQLRNVHKFVTKGMGRRISYDEITEETLSDALNAVLKDPSYKKNAMFESKRFKDRPMSAIDTAVYWVEYVIRNGPHSLRSKAADWPWYVTYSVDVFAFIFTAITLALYLAVSFVKCTLRFCRRKTVRVEKSKKRN